MRDWRLSHGSGVTLIELVVAVALFTLILTAVAMSFGPLLGGEQMRSAVSDVRSSLQRARIEAMKRNRNCRFEVNVADRTLRVWDGSWTDDPVDDVLVAESVLPDTVALSRPDGVPPVTLAQIGLSEAYETVFDSQGIVTRGAGSVGLRGGEFFHRVSVFGAGGIRHEHWDGSQWKRP